MFIWGRINNAASAGNATSAGNAVSAGTESVRLYEHLSSTGDRREKSVNKENHRGPKEGSRLLTRPALYRLLPLGLIVDKVALPL